MASDKKTQGTPPPVSTAVCSSFSAEVGAQVTFTGAISGCKLEKCQSTDTWPFCDVNGNSFGPPISFPLLANTNIYICSGLTVGQSYRYCTNSTCACAGEAMKTVTIVDGGGLRKKR